VRDRSAIDREHTRAHPGNTEIDVALTFATTGRPGGIVGRVAPDGRAFTLRQHISILPLPDATYRPRELDPRVGFYGVTFKDYGQPIQRALEQRWISRHRLQRVDPNDPRSPIKNPIRYWVDPGIPEPMRQATLEGVRFWTEAFDEGRSRWWFVAEFLPVTEDPLDARYNVVQWENRNERGWSVGGSLGDPRTGEILKGMARMDSHRARTDYNLYAALDGRRRCGRGHGVRARARAAGERARSGHTLGLQHNYIASHLRACVGDGLPSAACAARAEWRNRSLAGVRQGAGRLRRMGYSLGLRNLSRRDGTRFTRGGRRRGTAQGLPVPERRRRTSRERERSPHEPVGRCESPFSFLQHQTGVRRVALSRFGLRNIRVGEPVATLQERLVPLYFWHRFALNGVTKTIGGMIYQKRVAW
jgi:hypothetical protein